MINLIIPLLLVDLHAKNDLSQLFFFNLDYPRRTFSKQGIALII